MKRNVIDTTGLSKTKTNGKCQRKKQGGDGADMMKRRTGMHLHVIANRVYI